MSESIALVTGASRRLGKIFARALARRGYLLALHYHQSKSDADSLAEELRAEGGRVFLVQANLLEEEEIRALFRAVDSRAAPLRVLVNSAGRMQGAEVQTISSREWDETLTLNLRAPLLCAQEAARRMEAEGGLIVNITDAGASKAWTGYPAYIVSKAALESLTRVLARALAPNIRVNAIAPGLALPPEDAETLSADAWDRLVRRLPLPRPAAPEELAAALTYLLDNAYITGQTLAVDGGYSLL